MNDLKRLKDLKLNNYLKNTLFVVLVINFIFIMAMITVVNAYQLYSIRLLLLDFQLIAFCGILTTVLITIIVMLTFFYSYKGYYTSSILYAIHILYTVISNGKTTDNSPLTGLLMITIGYISCAIIHYNHKNLQKNSHLLEQQKSILNQIAYYDTLTNLPNRLRILSEINTMISSSNPDTDTFALIRIDIDNYRVLRDYLGHVKGEEELKFFADRLKSVIHPLDMPGRMNSDEFIVLVQRPLTKDELQEYVRLLQKELCHKITCAQNSFYLNNHYGISLYPEHGTETELLIQYADAACFSAKTDSDQHICFFNINLYQKLVQKTQIENSLREAIYNNEFYLVYQPQYSCNNKQLRGFEVLLRWNNPTTGLIPPSVFIPIAEETGTILSIGRWVLEQACISFNEILQKYDTHLILSINISAVQLLENSFVETVTEVLESTSFPPNLLEFEITETVLISSKDTVIRVLKALKNMGIHIALDDFGTEYASLSYLQLLPLDILKIDRSFINSIGEGDTTDLVESIINIAKKQSLITVAEGIETENQLNYLKEKGCQYVQGFLWGKPIPKNDLEELLSDLKSQNKLP